jgi:protein required for attachment to host cells
MKPKETWILVANSSEARFFRREGGHRLVEIATLVHPESRMHARDLTSDAPGRAFSSMDSTRHAVSTTVSVKRQESINFAHEVTAYIEAARTGEKIEALYIAASPAFLGILRQCLSPSASGLVKKELDKDITQLPVNEMWGHFE